MSLYKKYLYIKVESLTQFRRVRVFFWLRQLILPIPTGASEGTLYGRTEGQHSVVSHIEGIRYSLKDAKGTGRAKINRK